MTQWDRKEGGDGLSSEHILLFSIYKGEHDLLAVFVWWIRKMGYARYYTAPKYTAPQYALYRFHIHVMSSLSSLSLSVSRSSAISTESLLFLADSPAGELWMRWKAHTDIQLIKYHAKMPLKVWYSSRGHSAFSPTSLANTQTDSEGGRVVSSRRLNRRDMRQTVRVTDKQPWSLRATSREKHCLGVDNKLLPRWVIAARPMASPTETSILCHLKVWTACQWLTRDSARCVLLILEFMTLTFSWFLNVPPGALAYSLIESVHVLQLMSVHACDAPCACMNYPAPRCMSPLQGYRPSQISVYVIYKGDIMYFYALCSTSKHTKTNKMAVDGFVICTCVFCVDICKFRKHTPTDKKHSQVGERIPTN